MVDKASSSCFRGAIFYAIGDLRCCKAHADFLLGAIIPIPAGRMRNEFYPKRLAEYMTKSQLREVGMENIQSERDSTFGMYKPKAAAAPEKEERVEVEIDLLRVRILGPRRCAWNMRTELTLYSLNVRWLYLRCYFQPISISTEPLSRHPLLLHNAIHPRYLQALHCLLLRWRELNLNLRARSAYMAP